MNTDSSFFASMVSNIVPFFRLEILTIPFPTPIVVLPSALTENFPLILLEAMASGKPVICSDLPGVRNIVDDGINGLLAKPRDAKNLQAKIEYILGSKDVRDTFGKNGRLKAEKKYSWDKIALQLEKVYGEVLK